jgi:hypothetical protein
MLSLRTLARTTAFGFALLATPVLFAQQPPPKPEQLRTLSQPELDVIKVILAQERSWNEGNIETFATGYKHSSDTLFIGTFITRGYEDMLATYKRSYPNKETMGILSFSALEPRILDERFALVTGHYHLDREKKFGGGGDGVFSLLFEKTSEGWKIICDHSS